MSLLRDFVVNVVPKLADAVAPKPKAEDAAKPKTPAPPPKAPPKPAADGAKAKGEAGAGKAEIMERLTGLISPFKEAVAANGSNAKGLQTELVQVKGFIGKGQFDQAAKGLDKLEFMLLD